MGWRYLLFTLGGLTLLMWAVRFFVFPLYESPRFLVGRGKDAEAVAVVHAIAKYNGRPCDLTVDQLAAAGEKTTVPTSKVLSASSHWSWVHIKALFATRKMAFSTTLLIALWGKHVVMYVVL